MQLYFLITLGNVLTGTILASDYLARRAPALARIAELFGELFGERRSRVTLGALTAAAGFLGLIFPAAGWAFFGDLIPALVGIAAGGTLLATSSDRGEEETGSRTTKDDSAPVVKADGIVDRATKLGATYRVPLGLASVATGLLHFLLPGFSLL